MVEAEAVEAEAVEAEEGEQGGVFASAWSMAKPLTAARPRAHFCL